MKNNDSHVRKQLSKEERKRLVRESFTPEAAEQLRELDAKDTWLLAVNIMGENAPEPGK